MKWVIEKGKAEFLRGLKKRQDVKDFFASHTPIVGVAFVGRSNVGKSSLINTLFGPKTARVSKTPGRTREINVFRFELTTQGEEQNIKSPPFYLFDLPGYGHAEVSKDEANEWGRSIETFFEYANFGVYILNLQDARHPDQKADEKFYEYFQDFDLQLGLVLNKIDQLKTQKSRAELKKAIPALSKKYKLARTFFQASAQTKQGIESLEAAITDFLLKFDSVK